MVPCDCQVLIVIPSLLESVLNSPPKGFIERVKYINIDEVHKINTEEMGIPIERIILLSPYVMTQYNSWEYRWFLLVDEEDRELKGK